ncbi:MAG: hypothetical protein QM621_14770 [Aeromicrobium sp.]|uniref:hypothetical protein n=1 Tax=Aeromicrobium sp. TaxID=1871063 RepID=UPI0039E2D4D1
MSEEISVHRPVSRQAVRGPKMRARVRAEVGVVAVQVHGRRLREWAERQEGPYPDMAESVRIAEAELSVLVDALGSLVEIDPGRFGYDGDCASPRRGSWRRPDGRD